MNNVGDERIHMTGSGALASDLGAVVLLNRIVMFSRLSLFVIFAWFGMVKLLSTSAAVPLIEALIGSTPWALPTRPVMIALGLYEVAVGVAFIISGFERPALAMLVPHMIGTFLPLVLVPGLTWQSAMVPTIEGQFIIKNLAIIGLGGAIFASRGIHRQLLRFDSSRPTRLGALPRLWGR
jgi:hypothetical protein